MHRGVPGHALEAAADVEQFLDAGVLALKILESGTLFERFVERHVERGWNQLRHLVDVRERQVEHAPDVAHDRLGLHRPEGDDLRDVLPAVLAGDVVDDLTAPALAEVDVDVGQRHALGIEEALEDEVERDRIDVGDAQAPGDGAARGRAAAGTDRDALFAGEADEVPDDQEIPRVAHLLDHRHFVGEAALVLVDRVAQRPAGRERPEARQPLGEAVVDDVLEVLVQREAGGHVEVRQMVLPLVELHRAPVGDAHGVGERLRELGEERRHLGRSLQEELIAVIAQPLGIVDRLAGADAQQDVVRLEVVAPQVVHVVRADHRQAELTRQPGQAGVDDALLVQALILQLEEEAVRAQDVAIGGGGRLRPRVAVLVDALRDLALEAAAQADQPAGMRGQQVLVDAGLVVEAFRIPRGHQLDQVVEALVGLGQQHQMVGRLAGRAALRAAIARRDIHLAAENRLDAPLPRRVVEPDRGEHVAVLGDGEGRHPERLRLIQQFVNAARAVEQRELGVEVKVDELGHALNLGGLQATGYRLQEERVKFRRSLRLHAIFLEPAVRSPSPDLIPIRSSRAASS